MQRMQTCQTKGTIDNPDKHFSFPYPDVFMLLDLRKDKSDNMIFLYAVV